MPAGTEWWDDRAGSYDSLAWVHDDSLLSWAVDAVHGALDRLRASSVLEVGCGTGAFTTRLARLPLVDSMTAFDSSSRMVDAARERCRGCPIDVDIVQCAEEDYHPEPVDLVTCRMVLHHCTDPAASIARWSSWLRPDGALVVVDGPLPNADDRHPACDMYRAMMAIKEPGRVAFHAAEVAQWMLDAGLEHVEAREMLGPPHSVRNWLEGGGVSWCTAELEDGWRSRAIREILLHAAERAKRAVAMEVRDDDILLRWRQCAVIGRR